MLIHTAPSGFETFFARCAEEFAKPNPPDMSRIVEISAEHGIHYSALRHAKGISFLLNIIAHTPLPGTVALKKMCDAYSHRHYARRLRRHWP